MINVRMPNKEVKRLSPKITVVGVGGAGGNAVNNMISTSLQGCEFLVCNTDAQALEGSLCENKLQLGESVTGGLGAGAKPDVGREAAEESLDAVAQYLEGSNMAFITAGMGGGTGTGAAPVIARACRDLGILTVGVVTKPFHYEGTLRMEMAETGIEEMQQYVDTLIVIPNQNLFRVANEKTTFAEAFKIADSVLQSGVRGVTDLMVMPGLINLDFADIRSAMQEMGKAMMGTGEADGEKRATEAAEAAINNPLLDDVTMKGARGVIINVTGGMDMTLFEVDEACNRIRDEVDPRANIIFGSTFDEKLEGLMRVSVVATGIDAEEQQAGKTTFGYGTKGAGERKLDRTQPNTDATQKDTEAASAPKAETGGAAAQDAPSPQSPAAMPVGGPFPASPMQPSIPARGPMTAQAISRSSAQPKDDPESDMFEQQAFEAEKAPEPAPQQEAAESSETVMRGTIYKDSFIPPKPVEPEAARAEASQGQSQPQGQQSSTSLSATRPQPQQSQEEPPAQTLVSPGLNLKPPVPGANAQQQQQTKKKTPSLFERFTSPLRGHSHDEERDERGESGQASTSGGSQGPVLRQDATHPSQGSLNIDSPKVENAEDELDIPAFLRRQAN